MYPDDSVVGPRFLDTGEDIHPGDVIYLDNHRGVVREVCLPGSMNARILGHEGGALAIQMDDGGSCVIPFGNYGYVTRAPLGA